MPRAIVVNSYGLTTWWQDQNYKPRSFVLAGSNDNTTWTSLSDVPNKTDWVYGYEQIFPVQNESGRFLPTRVLLTTIID